MSTTASPTDGTIDARAFRDVMGHYPTGVAVVTATLETQPIGMVVGTFSSVSLDPPLVSFMPMKSSSTYQSIRQAESICISVLAHDQIPACRTLASKDPEKFSKVEWALSAQGAPAVSGAVAHIHGRISAEIDAGDHLITMVSVDDLAVVRPVTPLLFFQGGYGGFSTTGMSAHVDESLISAVRVAEAARAQLDRLAEQFDCASAALVQISAVDQTIGASSYGAGIVADERIGVRIPLIPPLGEAAVAWSQDQVDQWVARVYPSNEQVVSLYRATADRVRAQGYAVARIDDDPRGYHALNEALGEYGLSELTPARNRVVRGVIANSAEYFGGSIEDGETDIDIASLVVPVLDPDADQPRNSGLVLRLGSLPQGVDATTAHQWISALQQAAAEVATVLHTSAARDYARYTSSNLRHA